MQGHVAYPEQVINPIHRLAPALAEWCAVEWDTGSEDFPPTSMQVTTLQAGAGAVNVVPGELRLLANFRFSDALTQADIERRTMEIFHRHGLDCSATWSLSGNPFLTRRGSWTTLVDDSIVAVTNHHTQFSTSGGTSDGRFIAPTGTALVELGPVNATIHKLDERIALAELAPLARIYGEVLRRVSSLDA
jgi:succinyl-diaminopimelate desuccinylase